jgi:hypothetical protein
MPNVDDRRRLVQALFPFTVGVGISGDTTAHAEHCRPVSAELHGADRDVEFTSGDW